MPKIKNNKALPVLGNPVLIKKLEKIIDNQNNFVSEEPENILSENEKKILDSLSMKHPNSELVSDLFNKTNIKRILALQKTHTAVELLAECTKSKITGLFNNSNTSCDIINVRRELYSDDYVASNDNLTLINNSHCLANGANVKYYLYNNPQKISYVCQAVYNNVIVPEIIDTYTLRFKPCYRNMYVKNTSYLIYNPYTYFNVSIKYNLLSYNNNLKTYSGFVYVLPTSIGFSNKELSAEQGLSSLFYPYITNVYRGLHKSSFSVDRELPIPCFTYGSERIKINYGKANMDSLSEDFLDNASDKIILKINEMISCWLNSRHNSDGIGQIELYNTGIYDTIRGKDTSYTMKATTYYKRLSKFFPKEKVSKMKLYELGYKFPLKRIDDD